MLRLLFEDKMAELSIIDGDVEDLTSLTPDTSAAVAAAAASAAAASSDATGVAKRKPIPRKSKRSRADSEATRLLEEATAAAELARTEEQATEKKHRVEQRVAQEIQERVDRARREMQEEDAEVRRRVSAQQALIDAEALAVRNLREHDYRMQMVAEADRARQEADDAKRLRVARAKELASKREAEEKMEANIASLKRNADERKTAELEAAKKKVAELQAHFQGQGSSPSTASMEQGARSGVLAEILAASSTEHEAWEAQGAAAAAASAGQRAPAQVHDPRFDAMLKEMQSMRGAFEGQSRRLEEGRQQEGKSNWVLTFHVCDALDLVMDMLRAARKGSNTVLLKR